jgi:hypothetical protein
MLVLINTAKPKIKFNNSNVDYVIYIYSSFNLCIYLNIQHPLITVLLTGFILVKDVIIIITINILH